MRYLRSYLFLLTTFARTTIFLKELTLQQLEYALVLDQYRNFNKASYAVGISQPALSAQIKKLEESLGIPLFDRSSKHVEPTPYGKRIIEKARLVVNESRQLSQLALDLQSAKAQEIKLGIIPTLASYILPFFIDKIPFQLRIVEALTDDIIASLIGGDLDAGLIATPYEYSSVLRHQVAFYEQFKLFVSANHSLYQHSAIDPNEIPKEDLWLLTEGNCFRDQVSNICDLPREQPHGNFYYESNSIEALCRIVEYKGGITFLPELSTLSIAEEKLDMVKELQGMTRVREISMISLKNHIYKDQIETIVKQIQGNLPSRMLQSNLEEIVQISG